MHAILSVKSTGQAQWHKPTLRKLNYQTQRHRRRHSTVFQVCVVRDGHHKEEIL